MSHHETLVGHARRVRAAGAALRHDSRATCVRSIELRTRARRLRRQWTGAVFAMDRSLRDDPHGGAGYFARSVPVELELDDGLLTRSLVLELDDRGYVTGCSVGEPELLLGYLPSRLAGRHVSALYDDDAVVNGQPQSDLTAALASGEYATMGWRVRSDGTRFWASVLLQPRFGDHGRVVGFSLMLRDEAPELAADVPVALADGAPPAKRPAADDTINRLFHVGLTLQQLRATTADPETLSRIDEAIQAIDEVIRGVRLAMWADGGRPA